MKRFFGSILLILLIMNITAYALELSGEGTADSPYIIESYEDFYGFAQGIKNGDTVLAASHFTLGASIDFYGRSFIPAGTEDNPFTGVFDGDGFTLNNITHSTANASNGVFAYAENAVIKNLGVVDAVFNQAGIKESYTSGIICGKYLKTAKNSDTSFEKCFASGKISIVAPGALYGYAGGIAGLVKSTVTGADIMIENCETDCSAKVNASTSYCGGFAGFVGADKSVTTVEIKYLYTRGDISSAASDGNAYCGGMIGYLKAEESGWGEWMSEEGTALLSATSYALSNSISLCTVTAESTSGTAYASYTVSQTESGPNASKLYCTGADNATGGIKGTTVDASVIANSSFVKNTLGFDITSTWSFEGTPGIARNKSLCGAISSDGKSVHVRANGYINGICFVAAYDGSGRLTGVKHGICAKDGELQAEFDTVPFSIRVFALNGSTFSPSCKELKLK